MVQIGNLSLDRRLASPAPLYGPLNLPPSALKCFPRALKALGVQPGYQVALAASGVDNEPNGAEAAAGESDGQLTQDAVDLLGLFGALTAARAQRLLAEVAAAFAIVVTSEASRGARDRVA